MTEMWSLKDLRYDWGLGSADREIDVWPDDDAEDELMTLGEAIELAKSRSAHVIARGPYVHDDADDTPMCIIRRLALPPRWERLHEPFGGKPPIDEALSFEWVGREPCGHRDFLLDANGHTYKGRMIAWCPGHQDTYSVSLSEMRNMTIEAKYFVRGYLAGNEPEPPDDDYDDNPDFIAWREATARFRRTGLWAGGWSTCDVCGCVLLPDNGTGRCADHPDNP